ncbi:MULTISPECIES: FHA domain-containing protein [Dyella]|uniref:FHA domain-containing protein n=2 Tax=Dyella TaxID=231454 RepID=A0A4R0Z3C9_9GAMM|nr:MULTISPECIES: FHA domain-containing protein [Dyella]TBR39567.1 FHA domain-containing protein [Dyella terrae]TCI12850.1 FHA domain-containing protein [Dyella soli]
MRIEFPNSAREDFRWDQAQLRIGSAPDNDLILAAHQAGPHHLRIQQDKRGWVLQVLPAGNRIYLNARPVRERAILRAGDILSVGDCRMVLCADEPPQGRKPLTVPALERCTVGLRVVAGPHSGRVFPLQEKLELGPHGRIPLELPQGEQAALRVVWRASQLWLESAQQSERYPLRVNGVVTDEVALLPGDQIGLAMHRFVVDAPGMEPEPEIVAPPAMPEHLPEEDAGPRGEVWWLIVTAAVLALGIALILLVRF